MKKLNIVSLCALIGTTLMLSACGQGDDGKVEVKDKLFDDGKEVKIEAPGVDVEIDVPSTK